MACHFQLHSNYQPRGDQQQAIDKLIKSLVAGNQHQTLLGVTGSGKTFTMANVIAGMNRPTLVMSHNKTLAAQLYSEFKNFFPDNAVEYFVSYFDYYQPEAYIPRSDTYIEKDSSINDEIERLRLSAMGSLLTREDVIVVASVSCIYGLGSPDDYKDMMCPVSTGMKMDRDKFLTRLVDMLYERNDFSFTRGKFRSRGDVVDVIPAYLENEAIRVEFFGDEIDRISAFDPISGNIISRLENYNFYPAKQFVTPADKMARAIKEIRIELEDQVAFFEENQKFIEAQRIRQRTEYDIEMMQEMGFCQGIENYSRHLGSRPPGSRPSTLLDFFPKDYLTVIDESHATVPQVGGMYEGDKSRKTNLVDYGFRLPSALDNRPLKFDEFMDMTGQRVYVSATPARFEIENSKVGNSKYIPKQSKKKGSGDTLPTLVPHISGSSQSIDQFNVNDPSQDLIIEQIIRPTGLLDPLVELKPLKGQIDETIELCRSATESGNRVLVTTLTKRTAEDLTDYLRDVDLRVRYLHSDIGAIERVEILRALRAGEFDILVGINLLREGLDLPEVALVCILDADKEGYLRSETSLIQTAGRAARHVEGRVVLFCDDMTKSIEGLVNITEYRRRRQIGYNERHGIIPESVSRADQESLHMTLGGAKVSEEILAGNEHDIDVAQVISDLQVEMQEAASKLEFEKAALLRDQIDELKRQ
ncbi:MAG: excinuclease ABC subunit UvrB [Verrucomicrobiota bacterium]|nr:excinuclease ABC subunit B [Verrucomicrobiales bacterium]MED5470635.1 excinuclease ABC subunit UvrB [Verrucomicrobiota bacterium]MEE2967320.1 excinuclease ABC subunit UvrB [Verrucomicrobiota bacterium]